MESNSRASLPTEKEFTLFLALQIGVMLIAISNESLWIDEFWTAYFSGIQSLRELYELLLIPSGSQTPAHFFYYYIWGWITQTSEQGLRLANLPLFLAGQLSLFCALRTYPRKFAILFLAINSLHPMIWQYANEARPYIMIYAGSEMILAYILHMHATKEHSEQISTAFSAIFTFGSILLFGASLLGVFWVFAACIYIAYFHYRHLNCRYLLRGTSLLLGCIFLTACSLLSLYYLSSLIRGGGASRISSTTLVTLLFDAYELLGLSGIGPGRLELRDSGISSIGPYWIWLTPAASIILAVMVIGLNEAKKLLGAKYLSSICALSLMPVIIVVISGFAMHWRVLGRHMMAELPMLNLLLALGIAKLIQSPTSPPLEYRRLLASAFLLLMLYSSCSLRFSDRHRKDDYRTAAAIAQTELSKGKRVWWAADDLGARFYGIPGKFDYMGELTSISEPYVCIDQPGVQSVSAASKACLEKLAPPDIVILSKPETFDRGGVISEYLKSRNYSGFEKFPSFTIWRPNKKQYDANF